MGFTILDDNICVRRLFKHASLLFFALASLVIAVQLTREDLEKGGCKPADTFFPTLLLSTNKMDFPTALNVQTICLSR